MVSVSLFLCDVLLFFCLVFFFLFFYRVLPSFRGWHGPVFSGVEKIKRRNRSAMCVFLSLSLSLSLCLFIFLSRTHRTTSWSTWPSVTIDGVGGDGRDPHSVVGQPLRVLLLLLPAISHMSPSSVGVSSDDAPSPLVVGLGSRSLRRRSMQLE